MLGVWLNAADALVTVALMPSVAKNIGGYAYFAWAAGAFMLGGIVSCASGGHLAARLGLKQGLLLSAGLYGAGCVMSAAAPGVAVFLLGRLAQGVGAGWLLALVFVAIGVAFPERMAARLFSALAGVWGAATLLGPLVGGGFATLGLWRWVFWAFALQTLVFMAGVAWALPRDVRADGEAPGAPWPQLALVAAGVVGIAVAGVAHGWLAPCSGLVGLAILGLALAVDQRAEVRILPRGGTDLRRAMGLSYAAILLYSMASTPHTIYSPILIQRIHGSSPLVAGYVVACEAVGWSAVAVLVGGAGPLWQGRLIRIGGVLAVAGLLAIAATLGVGPVWSVALAALPMGAGFGCSFAFITARAVAGTEGHERVLASAAVPTLQYIGGSIGAAYAGIMAGVLGLGRPFDAAVGSAAALPMFGAFLPLMALGAYAAWRLAAEKTSLA
jgi:MFS family permease